VLEAVGAPIPEGLPGYSLAQDNDTPRALISECFPNPIAPKPGGQRLMLRALIEGPFKLIASEKGLPEMYDWKEDPADISNLWDKHSGLGKLMQRRLEEWVGLVVTKQKVSRPAPADAKTLERLRSLGYAQ
jgi:hypothetical protein